MLNHKQFCKALSESLIKEEDDNESLLRPGRPKQFKVLSWVEEGGKPTVMTVTADPDDPNSVIRGVASEEGLEEDEFEYEIIESGPGYAVWRETTRPRRIGIDVWQDHDKLMRSLRAKYFFKRRR